MDASRLPNYPWSTRGEMCPRLPCFLHVDWFMAMVCRTHPICRADCVSSLPPLFEAKDALTSLTIDDEPMITYRQQGSWQRPGTWNMEIKLSNDVDSCQASKMEPLTLHGCLSDCLPWTSSRPPVSEGRSLCFSQSSYPILGGTRR